MLPVRFSLSITVPALMLFVAVAIAIGRSLLIISSTIRFKKINYSRTSRTFIIIPKTVRDGREPQRQKTRSPHIYIYIYIYICILRAVLYSSKFAY